MSSALADVRLDHASPVPLYHQAAQALEQAIEDNRLPRGSKLESELDLAEHLGLEPATAIVRFDRLRLAGSDPIASMHNVVPAGLLKIEKQDLERTGLARKLHEE